MNRNVYLRTFPGGFKPSIPAACYPHLKRALPAEVSACPEDATAIEAIFRQHILHPELAECVENKTCLVSFPFSNSQRSRRRR